MRSTLTSLAAVVLTLTVACLANAQTSNGVRFRPQMPAAQVQAPLRNMNVTNGPAYGVPVYPPAVYPVPAYPAPGYEPAVYPTTPSYVTPAAPGYAPTIYAPRNKVNVRVQVIKR
jgi:hypothetical protein